MTLRRSMIRESPWLLPLAAMPPVPAGVKDFFADSSSTAWERLAERLLASPRRGERRGRRWLDDARWAETEVFESSEVRLCHALLNLGEF